MSFYKRLVNIYTKNNEIQTDEKSVKETKETDDTGIAFNFIHADEVRRIQQYNYNTYEYIINSVLSAIQSGILTSSIISNTGVSSYYYNFEYKDDEEYLSDIIRILKNKGYNVSSYEINGIHKLQISWEGEC